MQLVSLIGFGWIEIYPVDSTFQGLNIQDLIVMDGTAEGNGCRKDVLFMLNGTIKIIVCRNDQ